MKFLFDLFPVILFFIAFKFQGIYVATAVAIAATFCQVGWVWTKHGKVDSMLWASLAIIVVFGSATLLLHDETFIKWKPTILYWIFAAALLVSQLFFGKNLMRKAMEEALPLPDAVWPRVSYTWVVFLFLLGALNLLMAFVVFRDNTPAWVNFKVFGMTAIFFLFTVAQSMLLMKYIPQEEA